MSPSFSHPAERNRHAILEQLERILPQRAAVLETASGTGQHAAHFASSRPDWRWQPSERETAALPDIDARCADLPNALPAIALDVGSATWPVDAASFDAVYCANMIHIAPWPACAALMRGTARALAPHGALVLYGPYVVDGIDTAPSNLAFDADLRARNDAWGLRRLGDVSETAAAAGLALVERVSMPANNLLLVFRHAVLAEPDPPG